MLVTIPTERPTAARLPWVSLVLAGLWLGTCALLAARPDLDWESLALTRSALDAVTLAGHWLLHESWAHLAAGVVLVLLVGPVLEQAWGRALFAGLLALALVAGHAAYLLFEGTSARGLVGASAGLAALLAACLVRQWRDGIHYQALVVRRRGEPLRFWLPAYAPLGVWFGFEVLMQLVGERVGPTRGTGYVAQATGALLGAAAAYLLRQLHLERGETAGGELQVAHPALEAARQALERGDPAAALELLVPAVACAPNDAALVDVLCRAGCAAGAPEQACGPFALQVRSLLLAGQADAAADLWARWAEPLGRPDLGPGLTLSLAGALAERPERDEAARLLESLLDSAGPLSAGMAVRIAELARSLSPAVGIRAAQQALEGHDLPEPKRERLRAIVRELEALPAAASGAPSAGAAREDRSIAIDDADDLHQPPPGAASDADAPSPARSSRLELSADGSLVGSSDAVDLAGPADAAADTLPILDARPRPEPTVEIGLEVAAREPRFSDAKCVEVVPVAWEPGWLLLRREDAEPVRLELSRVQALAAGAVRGLAKRPVILIDLLLNWSELDDDAPLQILRLRSDRFDPAALVPDAGPGLLGFRALLASLLEHSGAVPLPDRERASGRPFAMFASLHGYEREVLLLER